ncbi:MAG: hypothetical protein JRI54_14025 [Deltaproteobacteria bacterium]|nr:hypothetical protein [Deltaproteobacteria bacterium]
MTLQARKWQHLLDTGQVASQAAIARLEGITRGRVTQIMSLLLLAPEIQQHILNMPRTANRPVITERALRHITQLENYQAQKQGFENLLKLEKSSGHPSQLLNDSLEND